MPDRDETITRLKFLIAYIHSPEGVTMNGMNKTMLTLEIAARDAIELLKEEAVEPVKTPETVRDEFNCGKCQKSVGIRFRGSNTWYYKYSYCPECGKKVAWSEEV